MLNIGQLKIAKSNCAGLHWVWKIGKVKRLLLLHCLYSTRKTTVHLDIQIEITKHFEMKARRSRRTHQITIMLIITRGASRRCCRCLIHIINVDF